MNYQECLKDLKPEHDFFIGIDSDGCVFDSMERKQKDFFIPNALKYFDLYQIEGLLRETWEFVNLYSVHRGGNRFTSLIKVFELLGNRKEVIAQNFRLPDIQLLKEWVLSETKLGNANLRKFYELNYNTDLEKVVRWTEAVNRDINRLLPGIPPFKHARTALERISSLADIVIVSQTPLEALEREWHENDLIRYISLIAGQEHGTKSEHLALAARGKYPDEKILMIGDARGDLLAAKNNSVLFFPIIPGKEDESWERFLNEGLEKFITGKYETGYENSLLNEFGEILPEIPPWLE